ncbi:hypothetical protein AAHE18_20G086200 [Arachis hypogaea]
MSALFNFHSFLTVILLGICACTYFKMQFQQSLNKELGERLSLWVSVGCFMMGVSIIFF